MPQCLQFTENIKLNIVLGDVSVPCNSTTNSVASHLPVSSLDIPPWLPHPLVPQRPAEGGGEGGEEGKRGGGEEGRRGGGDEGRRRRGVGRDWMN